jgi:hypothetical protein
MSCRNNETVLAGGTITPFDVVHITGDNTVARARADTLAYRHGTVGVALSGATIGQYLPILTNGKTRVLCESGLTILPGDLLYLSENVAGCATNVPPTVAIIVGTVKDTTGYSVQQPYVVADVQVISSVGAAGSWQPYDTYDYYKQRSYQLLGISNAREYGYYFYDFDSLANTGNDQWEITPPASVTFPGSMMYPGTNGIISQATIGEGYSDSRLVRGPDGLNYSTVLSGGETRSWYVGMRIRFMSAITADSIIAFAGYSGGSTTDVLYVGFNGALSATNYIVWADSGNYPTGAFLDSGVAVAAPQQDWHYLEAWRDIGGLTHIAVDDVESVAATATVFPSFDMTLTLTAQAGRSAQAGVEWWVDWLAVGSYNRYGDSNPM